MLGSAINIMATFVHNEPTCLNVIQEAGLPDTFYKIVEFGLEPVIEVCAANIDASKGSHLLGHSMRS